MTEPLDQEARGEPDGPRGQPDGPGGQPDGPRVELDGLREEIRALDAELVDLVDRRRDLAIRIGRLKTELGLPVMDPSQEARVVRRAAEIARDAGVDEEMIRDIVWRIIASARDAQEGRTRWGPPLAEASERGASAETD